MNYIKLYYSIYKAHYITNNKYNEPHKNYNLYVIS